MHTLAFFTPKLQLCDFGFYGAVLELASKKVLRRAAGKRAAAKEGPEYGRKKEMDVTGMLPIRHEKASYLLGAAGESSSAGSLCYPVIHPVYQMEPDGHKTSYYIVLYAGEHSAGHLVHGFLF